MATSNICRHYNKPGGCWYGEKCLFRHVKQKLSTVYSVAEDACRYFNTPSGCRFGSRCYFRHASEGGDVMSERDNVEESMMLHTSSQTYSPISDLENSITDIVPYISNPIRDLLMTGERESPCNYVSTKQLIGSVQCGECGDHFGGSLSSDLLAQHYTGKFQKHEPKHLKFLACDPKFKIFTECIVCGGFFDTSKSLFRHVCDKSKLVKNDGRDHLVLLNSIVTSFIMRDFGETCDEEHIDELQTYLCNVDGDLLDSDDDDFGQHNNPLLDLLGLHMLSKMAFDDGCDDDDDEDGCFGFSGGDVEELMCQGVMPWDEDAGAVLQALNGDY